MLLFTLLLYLSNNLLAQDGQLQLTAPTECDDVICNGGEGAALSTIRQRMGISFQVPNNTQSNSLDDDFFIDEPEDQSFTLPPSLSKGTGQNISDQGTSDGSISGIGNSVNSSVRPMARGNTSTKSSTPPGTTAKSTKGVTGPSSAGGGYDSGTAASSYGAESQVQAATTDGGQDSSSQSQQSYGGWGQFSGSRSSGTTGGARVANGYVYSDANPSSVNRGGTVSGLTDASSDSSNSSGSTITNPQASPTQASSLDRYSNVSATSLNKKMNKGSTASTASRGRNQARGQMASTAGMGGSSQFASGAAKPAKSGGEDSGGGLTEALSEIASSLGLNRFWGGLSSSSSSRRRSGSSFQVGSQGRNKARGAKGGPQQRTALLDRDALQRAYAQARGTASLEFTASQGSIFHQMCQHYHNYAAANRIPNDRGDCPQ